MLRDRKVGAEWSAHSSAKVWARACVPRVLSASISTSAKTWRGVSYAPFLPLPHWGFELAPSLSRFVSSESRTW